MHAEKGDIRRKRASNTLPNDPRGVESCCRESELRFSSNGRALLGRRLLRSGRLKTASAASLFVVPLGTIAAGHAQVTASNDASSQVPTVLMIFNLSPIFVQSESW